jgi:hypothetical protein
MVSPPSPLPVPSSSPPDLEGPVVHPTDHDVRLGRGRGCTNHFGNTLMEGRWCSTRIRKDEVNYVFLACIRRSSLSNTNAMSLFSDLIKTYSEQYANASKIIGIKGKKLVSTSIVQAIHRHGGRFIKHCPELDLWIQVPDAVARVKVAQALKYRCRKLNATLLRSQEGGSTTTTTTIEEPPARSSASMLTQITAAATMELLRSSSGGAHPPATPHPAPPRTVPRTPQSARRTPVPPFVASPPARARTTAVAVTPDAPPRHRRVVDFRYYFPGPPAHVDPSPVASMTRDVRPLPVAPLRDDEDDAISISSLGNDAYVAESLTTLIHDYIAVPPLSSSREEEEEDDDHRPLPLLETPPRPNALQRSTALSAKVLHDDDEDPDEPLIVLDK